MGRPDPRQIIPAYAGSTRWGRSGRSGLRDHPRIRGEHINPQAGDVVRDGSSPHTRGARVAGGGACIRRADHPRIRGEHADEPHWVGTLAGSSPHTRGAQRRQPGREAGARIIPAYAGSTRSEYSIIVPFRDHPRIRGEHPGPWPASHHTGGIIPAYAGSTSVYETIHTTPPDHPRIRGEHRMRPVWYSSIPGSSPHTRGAQTPNRRTPSRLGIIPAYAGSTSLWSARSSRAPDHPRIRGEHDIRFATLAGNYGSSPHTRGARLFDLFH